MELLLFFIALGILGAIATAWAHWDTYKKSQKQT